MPDLEDQTRVKSGHNIFRHGSRRFWLDDPRDDSVGQQYRSTLGYRDGLNINSPLLIF